MNAVSGEDDVDGIAVVGMAMRLPGADDAATLWTQLVAGSSCVTAVADGDLDAAGVDSVARSHPDYVRACAAAGDLDAFDAGFFGIPPAEAGSMDPQHRILLEIAYHALEDAGYRPRQLPGLAGLFAGTGPADYLHSFIADASDASGILALKLLTGNGASYACTRIGHRLDLRGPVVAVDTACSTSLVAVHMACRALLFHDCDLALAGGARVMVPTRTGYLFETGGIRARDGQCRPFDVHASGTVAGSGAAMLVLKRLDDARRDGDCIRAVIVSSAMNNDGRDRSDYAAPSLNGQAAVIAQALDAAQLGPDDISYLETHGTGTAIGDVIEIAALTRAFQGRRADLPPIPIGSTKANLGHLDVAAGAVSLIKTILALQHGRIPPLANFTRVHPQLDLDRGRLTVPTVATQWAAPAGERIAGVHNCGFGGTNAYVVVGEAPPRDATPCARRWHLLPVSADDGERLGHVCARLGRALATEAPALAPALADVAYTLAVGREALPYRSYVLAEREADAVTMLEQDSGAVLARAAITPAQTPPVAFVFAGLVGGGLAGAARDLYRVWAPFRDALIAAAAAIENAGGDDPTGLLLADPAEGASDAATCDPAQTMAALFVLNVAVARLWQHWGVTPSVIVGHGFGELSGAHIAGIVSLEAAAAMVVAGGMALRDQPDGAILVVPLDAERTCEAMRRRGSPGDLTIASIDGAASTSVAGPAAAIDAFAQLLRSQGIRAERSVASRALHTPAMQPVGDAVAAAARAAVSGSPADTGAVRVISTRSGDWCEGAVWRDPDYWRTQPAEPVRFAAALDTLAAAGAHVMIEIGPGHAILPALVDHQCRRGEDHMVAVPSLPRNAAESGERTLLTAAAVLWQVDAIDLGALYAGEERLRVPLPTYPFRRTRHAPPRFAPSIVALPPTTVGTVADMRTPDPACDAAARAEPESEPVSFMAAMTTLWAEQLGIDDIDPDDDFFALGGNSLDVMQIAARAKALNPAFDSRSLFDAPTLALLGARFGGDCITAGDAAREVSIAARPPGDGPVPLASQQARMWAIDGMGGAPGTYTIVAPVGIHGPLDDGRMRTAWTKLLGRHESFRTRIVVQDGVAAQRFDAGDIRVPVVDLSGLPSIDATRVAEATTADLAALPFDLTKGGLARLAIVRLAADRHRLVLTLHHIIGDHWSIGIALAELLRLYGGEVLAPLSLDYGDYAQATASAAWRQRIDVQLDYWQRRLLGAPATLDLPTDRPAARSDHRGARIVRTLDQATTARLNTLAKAKGASLYMVLLGAYSVLLGRLTGRRRVVVGSTVANRPEPQLEEIVGFFANTIALDVDIDREASFEALIDSVRTTVSEGLSNGEVSLEHVVERLRIKPGGGRTPLFETVFVLQNAPMPTAVVGDLVCHEVDVPEQPAKFDLVVQICPAADGSLVVFAEYRAALFLERTVAGWLDQFEAILVAALHDPARPVSALAASAPAVSAPAIEEFVL